MLANTIIDSRLLPTVFVGLIQRYGLCKIREICEISTLLQRIRKVFSTYAKVRKILCFKYELMEDLVGSHLIQDSKHPHAKTVETYVTS